ncbi:hypothetical protein [Rickettsiella massiliensis]|uniref:hypothetical protein n=1 Tax=Rickettsiella massiliensis TaxID=676517 RepID=UPI0012E9DB80|nr:hypothetical protein [Rickettsiella massiliensis]
MLKNGHRKQKIEASLREGRHFRTSEAKRHTLAQAIDYIIFRKHYLLTSKKKETN